ncbi:ATP/GTP-binding protein [Helicobacter sp. MIT 00-7814]|nr:ATP/GTP-binding protein [Helicobacter sp. MIT 99-10781]RDU56100.1 ATP/GTP-binding protein [Helicobacter sp. MIT 00-7814]
MLGIDFERTLACVYRGEFEGFSGGMHAIRDFERVDFGAFVGIREQMEILYTNTQNFLQGKDSCNALFWGARGCGKSSSMRAVLTHFLLSAPKVAIPFDEVLKNPLKSPDSHSARFASSPQAHSAQTHSAHTQESALLKPLRVIEIPKKSLEILPFVLDSIRELPFCFVIFCDDLAFGLNDESYKALKSLMEGSLEAVAKNVLIYATSNMRHLLQESYPQDTMHTNDAQDELIALSDRFGIALGFYTLGAEEFIALVESMGVKCTPNVRQSALNFATQKGSRNPRIAKEFVKLHNGGLGGLL